MISVRDVHKSYGSVNAVRGISIEMVPGQVVGLLGPNGAGKSTTIRMITGYLPPDSGRVLVGGSDTLTDSQEARRRIGYLPESAPLYPEMKAQDYLHYRARLFGMDRRARRRAVDGAIERCWLREMRARRIGTLSKGYRQRVGLAAALVHEPPVLVLDEPSNGLDPSQIRETRQMIRDLGKDRTLLISSHVLTEVEQIADRVVIVVSGRVRADGVPRDLVAARQGTSYVVQVRRGVGSEDEKTRVLWMSVPKVAETQVIESEGTTQGWTSWRLVPQRGAPDLREAIGRAVQAGGLGVRELRREVPSLERIYLELVEGDAPRVGESSAEARPI